MTSNSADRTRGLARAAAAKLRAWFDPPLDDDARPLEIRNAIVEQVEQLTEPAAAGRRVLPRNRIAVTLLARDKATRDLLQAALADIEVDVRARLAELRCPPPHGFGVDLDYVRKPRPDWIEGQRFSVDLVNAAGGKAITSGDGAKGADGSRGTRPTGTPLLRITVRRGDTTEREYIFSEPRVLIGRTAAPVDRAGRPRHNHVVFLDEGSEHNATVGRAHASIQFAPDRHQFRLFDDGSHNGTRIVRHGDTIDIAPHNPVGVALLSGDEIQFGTAAVLVTIEDGQ